VFSNYFRLIVIKNQWPCYWRNIVHSWHCFVNRVLSFLFKRKGMFNLFCSSKNLRAHAVRGNQFEESLFGTQSVLNREDMVSAFKTRFSSC
jgi:hypothetical protein